MSPNRKRSRSFAAPTSSPDAAPDHLALFRARLQSGDYHAVVGRPLRRALRAAAAMPGLEFETAIVRLALVRLLAEEDDASRLAVGLARLGAAAAQIARHRQPADSEMAAMRAHLRRELDAIEAEAAANQGEPPPSIAIGG